MEWMLLPYRRLYALIAGRASRQEYWMFVLFNMLIVIGVALLFLAFFGGLSALNPQDIAASMMAGTSVVLMIVLIIPLYAWALLTAVASFAVTIRRFHDLNLSGWVYLPFLIVGMIPLLNVLSFIGLIVMMCLKGTSGANKYGDDPTQPEPANVFA